MKGKPWSSRLDKLIYLIHRGERIYSDDRLYEILIAEKLVSPKTVKYDLKLTGLRQDLWDIQDGLDTFPAQKVTGYINRLEACPRCGPKYKQGYEKFKLEVEKELAKEARRKSK